MRDIATLQHMPSFADRDDAAASDGTASAPSGIARSILRTLEGLWHIRGCIPLAPGQSADDALDRLEPLFHQPGTRYQRSDRLLTFEKKDQAAQDKMSVFDHGVLSIEQAPAGQSLRYGLVSRALFYCMFAPLFFLAMAQIITVVGDHQKASAVAQAKLDKAAGVKKKPEPKKAEVPMNPIDKFLGAPEPEKPGKKGAEKPQGRSKTPTPTPAYVLACIFVVLYLGGRVLEDRLIKSLFRKTLQGA